MQTSLCFGRTLQCTEAIQLNRGEEGEEKKITWSRTDRPWTSRY